MLSNQGTQMQGAFSQIEVLFGAHLQYTQAQKKNKLNPKQKGENQHVRASRGPALDEIMLKNKRNTLLHCGKAIG